MVLYAVANGKRKGVFSTWGECKESVNGFQGAVYKKFETREEAEEFVLKYSERAKTQPATKTTLAKISQSTEPVDYYVYTDGSCSNNGRNGAAAGIGIFFGADDPRNVSRRITGKQTNNTAELSAILETYPLVEHDLRNGTKVAIVSDSEYAIRCATTYGNKQMEENWKNDIPNKELVKQLYERYVGVENISFLHIMAHTGKEDIHSVGNDGADKLANLAIGHEQCPYTKIYLDVAFSEKDHAKQLGASWDFQRKKWWIGASSPHKDELVQRYGAS
jgi:ribonuclease HI